MTPTVVVPWRGGCPHREAAWQWVEARYRALGWPVIVAEHNAGPWCKAEAFAEGINRTDTDVLVLADADCWVDTVTTAVEAIEARQAQWAVPHRAIRRLTHEATAQVLVGADPMKLSTLTSLEQKPYKVHPGGGVVVLTRQAWETAPMDPRFKGWGHEDDSHGRALAKLCGPPWQGRGHLWHLWHPPQERPDRKWGCAESVALGFRYQDASSRRAMRALIAEFTGRSDDTG